MDGPYASLRSAHVNHTDNTNPHVNAESQAPPGGPPPAATLDSILKQMREAEERRKDLERQHADTLRQLRLKQSEFQNPSGHVSSTAPHGAQGGLQVSLHQGGQGQGGGQHGGPPVNAVANSSGGGTDRTAASDTIEALQSKIRELEKKTELQNVRHEELLLEMASIKRSAGPAGGGPGAGQGGGGGGAEIGRAHV